MKLYEEPAHPFQASEAQQPFAGLTKIEYAAIQIMAGANPCYIIPNATETQEQCSRELARRSFEAAKALFEELEKQTT